MNAFTFIATAAAPSIQDAIQTNIDTLIDQLLALDETQDILMNVFGAPADDAGVLNMVAERKIIRFKLDALSDAMAQFIEPVFCMPEDLEPMGPTREEWEAELTQQESERAAWIFDELLTGQEYEAHLRMEDELEAQLLAWSDEAEDYAADQWDDELEASLQAYAALEMAPRTIYERAIWVESQF